MSAEILHPNADEFEELLKNEKFVIVDFWATWCGPCRMVAPVIEQLAEKYEGQAVVAKVDVDEHQDLAIDYGIQTIPTVLFFREGELVATEIGVKPLTAFEKVVEAEFTTIG